jgi:hypothetical protein
MFLVTEKSNKSKDRSLGSEQRTSGFQAAGHLTLYFSDKQ